MGSGLDPAGVRLRRCGAWTGVSAFRHQPSHVLHRGWPGGSRRRHRLCPQRKPEARSAKTRQTLFAIMGLCAGDPQRAPFTVCGGMNLTAANARSSSLKSNPATVVAFSRRRTGNPNERRETDEPGSRPDGNSDWLLSHALSRRHRPYSGSTSSNSAQG